MKRTKQLGLGAGILAVAFLLGGCGAHAGFSVGKSSDPTAAQASNTTEAQSEASVDASE